MVRRTGEAIKVLKDIALKDNIMIDVYKLNKFTRQFLETALWAEHDHDGSDNPEPLDKNYSITDFAEETVLKLKADCDSFCEANRELLNEVSDTFHVNDEQHGHDFWLTRNGHGVGFWDRGYGELGKELSDKCELYKPIDLEVGDDGKIYCFGG